MNHKTPAVHQFSASCPFIHTRVLRRLLQVFILREDAGFDADMTGFQAFLLYSQQDLVVNVKMQVCS